jgi:hypothetical protein
MIRPEGANLSVVDGHRDPLESRHAPIKARCGWETKNLSVNLKILTRSVSKGRFSDRL